MKSLANKIKETDHQATAIRLAEEFEDNHYKMKNEYEQLKEDYEQLKYSIENDHQSQLVSISKKLNKTLKSDGADAMVNELMLERAKVLDHFSLAYLAEMGCKPSEVKFVNGINSDGYFEVYFTKKSSIILPGE